MAPGGLCRTEKNIGCQMNDHALIRRAVLVRMTGCTQQKRLQMQAFLLVGAAFNAQRLHTGSGVAQGTGICLWPN